MKGQLNSARVGALALCLMLLSACSSAPTSSSLGVDPDPRDPYENFNRKVYSFNDAVDKSVLVPIVNVYETVTPDIVEQGVSNFFSNLRDIGNFLNHTLQLKPKKAANDLGRLIVNSTIGIGGLMDIASQAGVYQESEDLGQTLAYWGIGSGPYVVLPFLGPSTIRDASASAVDTVASPVQKYDPTTGKLPLTVLELIDLRHSLGDFGSLIKGDPYVFVREAYLQRREYMINDGLPSGSEDFEDFEDF